MLYLTLVLSTEYNIFGDFFFQNRRNIKTRKSSKRFQNSTQKGDKGHNQAENNNNNNG